VSDPFCWAATDADGVRAVIWDWRTPDQQVSNRSFFGKPRPSHDLPPASVSLQGLAPGRYRLTLNRTGYLVNDAHTAYLQMGEPKDLDATQLQRLQYLTRDRPESERELRVGRSGRLALPLRLRTHDVVLLRLERLGA
jgi:xylan 1,4-beta-xylosidase